VFRVEEILCLKCGAPVEDPTRDWCYRCSANGKTPKDDLETEDDEYED
jgi:NMD protein affecting ribosome stability and mRNA decay